MVDEEVCQTNIAEEYKIWKKNVPYLYDLMFSHALKWPSLSVQVFPETKRDEAKGKTTQRLLLGTHTSGAEQEYIHIAHVDFPDKFEEALNDECRGDMRFKIGMSIPVCDEPNVIRYNPLACNIIASRFDTPETHIFDYTKHPMLGDRPNPDMILIGHENGGFGLTWNPLEYDELATAGADKYICIYDINNGDKKTNPKLILNEHTNVINDVCYSYHFPNVLASVSDDKSLIVWDTKVATPSTMVSKAHEADILSVHFSPLNANLLATSSQDKTIKVWDIRNSEKALYHLTGHSDAVGRVQWSPHVESVLASSGKDRRVCLWDLSPDDKALFEDKPNNSPSELMFLHGGHTDNVFDIAWNPSELLEIVSVSEDNILQIWQVPENSTI